MRRVCRGVGVVDVDPEAEQTEVSRDYQDSSWINKWILLGPVILLFSVVVSLVFWYLVATWLWSWLSSLPQLGKLMSATLLILVGLSFALIGGIYYRKEEAKGWWSFGSMVGGMVSALFIAWLSVTNW